MFAVPGAHLLSENVDRWVPVAGFEPFFRQARALQVVAENVLEVESVDAV